MGCCSSICRDRQDTQEGSVCERTHLLVDPVRNEPAPLRPTRTTQPPRKTDEQSALCRILQETATNVIDVGALGSHALEPHEYNERVKLYQSKLSGIGGGMQPGAVGVCVPPPQPRLLRDIPQAEKNMLFTEEPIAPQDKQLIAQLLKKAVVAMGELKVEHREDLVVPFRIP